MFNTAVFQGNLVRDPEFADTRDSIIVNFTIASSRKYKDKEDVTFLDCTAYGQTAENVGKFFSKGAPIGVQGRLSQNNWEDQEGNKRTKIYITVDSFHFVGPTDRQDRGGGHQQGGNNRGGGRDQGNRGQSGGRVGNQRGRKRYDNEDRNDTGKGQGQREGSQGGGRNDYEDDVPF